MEYKTPQDVEDEKRRGLEEEAYMRSLTNTEPAPKGDARKPIRGQRGYAKGGSVTRADGCVTKGHTKGRMI